MKKILPAIGVAASLAATSANATASPPASPDGRGAQASIDTAIPAPTETFVDIVNRMTRDLTGRWRVSQDFHDKPPFGKLPTFGKAGGGGFVKFTTQFRNRAARPRPNVSHTFRQHKP